jgi:preprotein translocase subunit SecA
LSEGAAKSQSSGQSSEVLGLEEALARVNSFKGVRKALHAGEGKKLRAIVGTVDRVNELEAGLEKLSDQDLAAKTPEFQRRFDAGESMDELLPEAFATVREVARRKLGQRHFDVQIAGGIILHQGMIAEMATGEGKTLTATLPVYLNHFPGLGIHVITVNEYLAGRDSEWMGEIYRFLGMEVGCIRSAYSSSPQEKREAYLADVTYGTNNEFGFDYLRDNLVTDLEERVQRGHNFGIVDEVDSILIDEARTPLIISGEARSRYKEYLEFSRIARRMKPDTDYEVDVKDRLVVPTEDGVHRAEQLLAIDHLYDGEHGRELELLSVALQAKELFKRDVEYLVKDGKIVIVDEFTGRLMEGRRFSGGIHEAIEAKEGVLVEKQSQTLATVTFQNYFRNYSKLSGMTGTAVESRDEFKHVYDIETMVLPTHSPMVRDDQSDVLYKTEKAKFDVVAEKIAECYERGQPVLVGTVSVEKSEYLSGILKRRGIPHEVLNAKEHTREAEIIQFAGEPARVTIATNMAGRGVDIKLGEGVVEVGGLMVIGTERHESRRIDNQLRGRSGRQGDPGVSRFYLSLEDDIVRRFAPQSISNMIERVEWPDDQPLFEHRILSRAVEKAQESVMLNNLEARKNLLKYDDVLNSQRKIVYEFRDRLLAGDDFSEDVGRWIEEVVDSAVDAHTNPKVFPEEWDLEGLFNHLGLVYPLSVRLEDIEVEGLSLPELRAMLMEDIERAYAEHEAEMGAETLRGLERHVILQLLDNRWIEILDALDELQEGIGLRGIAGRDPLVEYTAEAYDMFKEMTDTIGEEFMRYIFGARVVEMERERAPLRLIESSGEEPEAPAQRQTGDKVGRNDPCPCGSGKKYKKCCGVEG